ncbi:MAG: ABC transporter ATP-binding protein/permease [Spirochaeta sp.]|nr:ABC transporter ATP-binding protein/permease [Spirochaeta sp.]
MEEEKVIKGYDPLIMKRLLAFLRPYKLVTALSLMALLIATVGELLLPVVLQRALDHHVLNRRRAVDSSVELPGDIEPEQRTLIEDEFFITESALTALSRADRRAYEEAGLIDDFQYIVVSRPADVSRVRDVGALIGDTHVAIPLQSFSDLPLQLQLELRSADLAGLRRSGLLFLVILIAVLLFGFIQVYSMAIIGQRVMMDLRLQLFDHTMHQSSAYLSRNPVGRIVTRLTNDVETVNELFTSVLMELVKDIALMLGVIITLFALNRQLGLVTLLTLPPVIVLTEFFRHRARDAFRSVRLRVSAMNTFLSEHISGMSVVQLFAREHAVGRTFTTSNNKLLDANLGEMYVFATFRPLIEFLAATSTAVVIYFGAGFLLDGAITLGVLIAFLNLVRLFYQPVRNISEKFNLLQSAMAGGERVFHLLDERERILDDPSDLPPPHHDFHGTIEFRNVKFAYLPGEPVLRNLSFTVPAGKTAAVVGFTGAGKTTIVNLLTRLWDVESGAILIDGQDIRTIPLSELRSLIQPIQQDVFLFNDTIRNNLTLGAPFADERIISAAKAVQAHTFIEALPAGYDTVLAEQAVNISTGQRQLLSLARVVAHDPKILILDEATANIDTQTEQSIQQAMNTVLQGRTSIVIAHRLSTIRTADTILVLSAGELLEQGQHEELLAKGGLYASLHDLQYLDA